MPTNAWSNDALDTLVIPTGATTGARIVLDGITGTISVYNSSNQLVGQWGGPTGRLATFSPATTAEAVFAGGSLFFEDSAQNPQFFPQEQGLLSPTQTILEIFAGIPQNAAGGVIGAALNLITGTTIASAWIQAVQRGVTGATLQTDSNSNSNQLVHIGAYDVTTDAGGTGTFNHGAAFTPMAGFLAGVNGIGANFPYQYAWFASPFTSTTAKAAFKDNLGNALGSTTVGVYGFFLG